MAYNPYSKYQEQSIMTMTPGEMVVKLYEECEKQLYYAKDCIEKKNYAEVNKALQKTQKIFKYLKATLDYKYEVSNGLAKIYDYINSRMVDANIRKDPKPLDDIIPIVTELLTTFQKGERLVRTNKVAAR